MEVLAGWLSYVGLPVVASPSWTLIAVAGEASALTLTETITVIEAFWAIAAESTAAPPKISVSPPSIVPLELTSITAAAITPLPVN